MEWALATHAEGYDPPRPPGGAGPQGASLDSAIANPSFRPPGPDAGTEAKRTLADRFARVLGSPAAPFCYG